MDRPRLISDQYQYATVAGGLRIVHLRRPKSDVAYFGVAIKAGSSDDGETPGLAHFVEHTIFKGTTTRTSSDIINHIESVGGELNAYTTKDETMIYSAYPAEYTERAVSLIADLIINSTFPSDEIDRERKVIIEEIDSYLDNPAESVFDDFEDIMFKGTPWGHNILGNEDSVCEIDSDRCRRFLTDYYHRRENTVLFYSGPDSFDAIVDLASKYFDYPSTEFTPLRSINRQSKKVTPFTIRRRDNETHQAHTIMGALTPSVYWSNRYALSLLNNIIGGPSMNSRLNEELRERRGLVYSVDSSINLYREFGAMNIYFGCSTDEVDHCWDIVIRQLGQFAQTPLTPDQLAAAKCQYSGQLTVASASPEQTILSAARATLWHNRAKSVSETQTCINGITADEIVQAAQLLKPELISTLTLG